MGAYIRGMIFDIQHYAVHDGPGIRTLVFLKGCNFHCPWCENPEGISRDRQLMYYPKKCIGDFICIEHCPENALEKNSESRRVEVSWERCTHCLNCTEACTPEALKAVGREVTVDEVIEEVKADRFFYGEKGGITLSGGEPTLQKTFAVELLQASHQEGINTAIETNGSASPKDFSEVLFHTDHLLIDIKHIDPVIHKKYIGLGNENVLKNFISAVKQEKDVTVRVPVIPGFNMDEKNLTNIARFVAENGGKKLHLLPYHTLGASKCEGLGKPYQFPIKRSLHHDEVIPYKNRIEANFELMVEIGG